MRQSKANRTGKRAGFTLVEMMIVVVIIGILAAIAIPSYIGYLYRSKTTEAVGVLADIKARQEAYRSEYFQYCDVSKGNKDSFWPATQNAAPQPWTDTPDGDWASLGVNPTGREVYFGYVSVAGSPGDGSGAGAAYAKSLGYDGSDFWFISRARADLNGDGTYLYIESYSARQSLYVSSARGWD